MDPELTTWRYLSSRGIEPSVVTKDGDSGAKYSANDYFVSLGWGYNDLDRGFFPRAGNKSSLSGKVTLPGSDNSYYKLSFDTAQYLPLSENKRWVWMERLRAGYAGGLDGKSVPFYDNFYAGGSSSVRGFSSNTIGPKAAYYRCNGSESSYSACPLDASSDAVGGNAMAVLNSEFIIPTPFVNDKYADSLRTSLFVDAGTVWSTSGTTPRRRWRQGSLTTAIRVIFVSPRGLPCSGCLPRSTGLPRQSRLKSTMVIKPNSFSLISAKPGRAPTGPDRPAWLYSVDCPPT